MLEPRKLGDGEPTKLYFYSVARPADPLIAGDPGFVGFAASQGPYQRTDGPNVDGPIWILLCVVDANNILPPAVSSVSADIQRGPVTALQLDELMRLQIPAGHAIWLLEQGQLYAPEAEE